MIEWSTEQWQQELESKEKVAFYLYTPMCGTCAVASKMMEVVEQILPALPVGKANINFTGSLPYDLKIESVPCLIISEKGEVTNKIYAFQSVPYLYELLK